MQTDPAPDVPSSTRRALSPYIPARVVLQHRTRAYPVWCEVPAGMMLPPPPYIDRTSGTVASRRVEMGCGDRI